MANPDEPIGTNGKGPDHEGESADETPEIHVKGFTPPPDFAGAAPTPPPVAPASLGRAGNRESGGFPVRPGRISPLPPNWAAQPMQPMLDEATVPLPVEEVEFAESEGDVAEADPDFEDRPTPAPRVTPPPAPNEPVVVAPPPPPISAAPPRPEGATGGESGPAEARTRPLPPPPPPRPSGPPPVASAAPMPALDVTGSGGKMVSRPLLPPGATWTEALSQRPRKKRLKPWFEEVFDEDYLRTLPFMTSEQTLREVDFIRDSLNPAESGELLDVGCGYGRHAIELGEGGFRVTGIDLSLPLLIRAADESQRRALSVNFVHADMREMAFANQFDGAYMFLTSFGYFDEETNLKVAASVFRALRPGGRFLVDVINRDYVVSELPTRVWWEGEGCVVLEEVDFNYQTSRLGVRRSVVFQDGRQVEHDISIRAYGLHELGKLMRQAGFRVLEVSGGTATRGRFFGCTSRSVIMLCERPPE